MKIKTLILFLVILESFAQKKPMLHLIVATDVEDNAYTVRNFGKEEKILNMYSLICRELNFDLKTQYLHRSKADFNAKNTLDQLAKIKVLTNKDDIIVFYYIGRGYYASRNSDFPLLEFRDTKNMLSISQIREKLKSTKARLTLAVADCDESSTLANPRSLPHSIIRTGSVDHQTTGFEKTFFAAIGNEFNPQFFENTKVYSPSRNLNLANQDSLYLQNCLSEIDVLLTKENLSYDQRKQIAIISQIISAYPEAGYPKTFDDYRIYYLKEAELLSLSKYQYKKLKEHDYKLLVDSLFLKKAVLNLEDALNITISSLITYETRPLIPGYWKNSKSEDIDYFLESFEKINVKIANINFNKPLKNSEKRDFAIYKCLEGYKTYYLPNTDPLSAAERKASIERLPEITNELFRTIEFGFEDYSLIIDSMFVKRSLFKEDVALSALLDKYIEFEERPLKRPIEFLTKAEVEKYYFTLDELENILTLPINKDSIQNIKLVSFIDRLESYTKIGFPSIDLKLEQIPSSRDVDIKKITDILYNSGQILQLNDPLQLKLDSIIDETLSNQTVKLNKEEWEYYVSSKKALKSMQASNDTPPIKKWLISTAIKRLNRYPTIGFPTDSLILKNDLQDLLQASFYYGFEEEAEKIREDYRGVIIDSLYKSKQLLNLGHPLYSYLDSLIINSLPKGIPPPPASMSVEENTSKPIVMQLFLSECGSIEVANGHKRKLNKNQYIGDYTDFTSINLGKIFRLYNLNKIGELSLKNLYAPYNNKFVYSYKNTIPKTCSVISGSFDLPDFSKLPSTGKVNEMFEEYIKANNIRKKKELKTEITSYFENDAKLKVKPKSIIPGSRTRITSISLNDYFMSLDNQNPKVESVDIREGSVKRNQNFSKITTMMLVEK